MIRLIIGRKGTVGAIHYENGNFWPIDTTYFINNDCTDLSIEYLYRLLSSIKLIRFTSASAVPGLNRDDVYSIKVALSPLAEQEKIAKILTDVDTKLEKEREYKAGLEELKRDAMQDLLTGRVRVPKI